MAWESCVFGVGLSRAMLALACSERSLVAGDVGLRLVERGFQGAAVDFEELLALLDEIAFLEIDLGQLAAHQGFDGDGGVGLDVADDLDFHRHVAGGSLGHGDGDIAAGAAASTAPSAAATTGRVRLRGSRAAVRTSTKGQGEKRGQAQEPRAAGTLFDGS